MTQRVDLRDERSGVSATLTFPLSMVNAFLPQIEMFRQIFRRISVTFTPGLRISSFGTNKIIMIAALAVALDEEVSE